MDLFGIKVEYEESYEEYWKRYLFRGLAFLAGGQLVQGMEPE